jgi:hypothetical protein
MILLYVKNWIKFLFLSTPTARKEGNILSSKHRKLITDYFKELNLWQ